VKASTPSEAELPEGFYDLVFPEHSVAEELLLPYLVSDCLYHRFSIGHRPKEARKNIAYMVRTHGNLTVLALVGRAIRWRYELEMPLQSQKRQLLGNILIPRFGSPSDHPEFTKAFDRGVRILLDGLDDWVRRAVKRQKREEGSSDVRKIFISPAALHDILQDRKMKLDMKRCRKKMPDLAF
jgi:hypothetical protein